MTTLAVRPLEEVELAVDDGTTMRAHVARPSAGSVGSPGVLVLQDAYGWTGFLADVTERFAAAGFTAIAPELYHRNGHGLTFSYEDDSITYAPDRPRTDPTTLIADGKATYAWLAEAIGSDRIAAYGFCMGGRMAYLLNAYVPLRAAVSLYGGGCHKLLEYAERQHGPILFGWGGLDHVIDAAQRRALYDGLAAAGVDQEHVVFGTAQHGFYCHARPQLYHESASRQILAMSEELFRVTGITS